MISIRTAVQILGTVPFLLTSMMAQTWSLPKDTTVKDNGPRTYRFTVDYNVANTRGEVVRRQRLTGEYTRGLPGGDVVWNNVTDAAVNSPTDPFPAADKQTYMEGFRYHHDAGDMLKPEFFRQFPPTATMEKNLVWDTAMFEVFGQEHFAHLKLNQPYQFAYNEEMKLPGLGSFTNHDVTLVWVGNSQKNGKQCAVIEYRAFFNPLDINGAGIVLKGRSNYWGMIWVSLATKQIEYATLYEDVLGELTLPDKPMQVTDVFRIGTFEPVRGK
ncbi:MAG TPA: hypothetical protein VKW78_07675 [Terriglobales bacterium]|nr:hypothetical protein [Terriglobales bacterium]